MTDQQDGDGRSEILLTDLAASIREGVAQSEAGQTVDRGSFAQYADGADDDDRPEAVGRAADRLWKELGT